MLRHSILPSKFLAEVSVAAKHGYAPVAFYHSRSRFHEHLTYSKMRSSHPRKNIVDVSLLRVCEPVTSSLTLGDMVRARGFQFNAESLNARGFLRFQKAYYAPLADVVGKVMQICRSCMKIRWDDQTLIGTKLKDSKLKYESLTKQFQHDVPNSMLHMMCTPVRTKDSPPTSERKPSSSNVLGKKRAKTKGPSSSTVMDEYGYNYDKENSFPITAYAVCDEFDLKTMHKGLISQGLYIPTVVSEDLTDVIHVSAKYPIGDEPREIFFFREGAVVFWNVPYLEIINVLKFLKEYENESYGPREVEDESEYMSYVHSDQGPTRLIRGRVYLGNESDNKLLEKYAFANALASSVKLGIWEATLEKYVEGIERITEALKRAEELKLSRGEVMQKTGELFALRHQLNLNSDLLDTPDFYWERERLETLYQKTCDYLSVNRRTKVMNEKLTQCCELLDLISTHLTDQHHTRLEWMIIILIMIEVGFEILHLLERYELIQM